MVYIAPNMALIHCAFLMHPVRFTLDNSHPLSVMYVEGKKIGERKEEEREGEKGKEREKSGQRRDKRREREPVAMNFHGILWP